MLLGLLITNKSGNILLERFHGVSPEDKTQWKSFMLRVGQQNLPLGPPDEHKVAYFRNTYLVYTAVADVHIYLLGQKEYDALTLSEAMFFLIDLLKAVCKRAVTEAALLDRYGKLCLALDEFLVLGHIELMDVDRILRATKMQPLGSAKA